MNGVYGLNSQTNKHHTDTSLVSRVMVVVSVVPLTRKGVNVSILDHLHNRGMKHKLHVPAAWGVAACVPQPGG